MSGQIYAVNPDGARSGSSRTSTPSTSLITQLVFGRRHDPLHKYERINFGETDSRIWIMDADGSNKRRVADDAKGFRDYTPKFTPNAAKIVFSRCQPDDGVCAIWGMRADGTHKQALTRYIEPPKNEAVDFDLSVSPNGKRIAYSRFFGGGLQARIFVMKLDGGNRHVVTPPYLEAANPDWAPSGRRIGFENNGARNGSSIFTIAPTGPTSSVSPPTGFPKTTSTRATRRRATASPSSAIAITRTNAAWISSRSGSTASAST